MKSSVTYYFSFGNNINACSLFLQHNVFRGVWKDHQYRGFQAGAGGEGRGNIP